MEMHCLDQGAVPWADVAQPGMQACEIAEGHADPVLIVDTAPAAVPEIIAEVAAVALFTVLGAEAAVGGGFDPVVAIAMAVVGEVEGVAAVEQFSYLIVDLLACAEEGEVAVDGRVCLVATVAASSFRIRCYGGRELFESEA